MRYGHGGDIYTNEYKLDFSSNINPFGMHPAVRQAAICAIDQSPAYPDSRCHRLTQALSEKCNLPGEWFVVGNGGAELIFSLVLANKPKRGMILAPAFLEYEQALASVDCQVVVYERKPEDDFRVGDDFLLDLERELKDGLEMVFFCSPDNPTGDIIPKKILEQALALCEEYDALMVLDESFCDFCYDNSEDTMLWAVRESKHLFILRSFTKMYAMPGLRVGYGISSDLRLMERISRIRQPWSVSIPAQEAGIAALALDGWEEKTRKYVDEQREWMSGQLKDLGMRIYSSRTNYLFFYSEIELEDSLKQMGILVRDCSNYRGLEKGYYRVAVKLAEENQILIEAITSIVRSK